MTQEEQLTIFNRFAQANLKTHHEYGGSGLGLFICKSLVDLMGGRITVASKIGEGSEFSFTVKCQRPKKPLPQDAEKVTLARSSC